MTVIKYLSVYLNYNYLSSGVILNKIKHVALCFKLKYENCFEPFKYRKGNYINYSKIVYLCLMQQVKTDENMRYKTDKR